MMKNISSNKQSGAVSLFVVIFAMLIITVITVSFIRIMVADQQQATDNDLSQSAYDSALAGVEDAKRAILSYQQECSSSPLSCSDAGIALASNVCNEGLTGALYGSVGRTSNEVQIQQSAGDGAADLNQYYTCVKILLETNDYTGHIDAGTSQLVPLISREPFDRVGVEWFSSVDLTAADAGSANVNLLDLVLGGEPLYTKDAWPVERPPIMRAQLIQFANRFSLDSFDAANGDESNAATVFLYPTKSVTAKTIQLSGTEALPGADYRAENRVAKSQVSTPLPIQCKQTLNEGGYACKAVLVLPDTIDMTAATDRTAFLRLEALYNAASFKVTMWNGDVDLDSPGISPQKFKDVQPEIDSTGRANDIYRRVVSRVNLYDTSFPYPEATIDVTGNFCKDFAVTNENYYPGSCNP